MLPATVHRCETRKSPAVFAADLANLAHRKGFVLHNRDSMDMAETFARHGQEVGEGFDLQMIQLCKPERAAKSLQHNPERAVLMPKFIMAFSQGRRTAVRFLHFAPEAVVRLVEGDPEFPFSLDESCRTLIDLIEQAASES